MLNLFVSRDKQEHDAVVLVVVVSGAACYDLLICQRHYHAKEIIRSTVLTKLTIFSHFTKINKIRIGSHLEIAVNFSMRKMPQLAISLAHCYGFWRPRSGDP